MYKHVRDNPDFPYPRGGPIIIDVNKPHRFRVGQKIRASKWVRYAHRIDVVTVLMTRKIASHRRDPFIEQVIVSALPNDWFAASHFEPHEYEGVPIDQIIVWPWFPEDRPRAPEWVRIIPR